MSRTLTLSLSATVLLSALCASANAWQAAPRANASATPEFPEQVLVDWYRATSQIKTLQGNHKRWVYDNVFGIEKRTEGLFYYVSPDKGRIDFKSSSIKPGTVSQRKTADGAPYALKPGKNERYVCDGLDVRQINDTDKTVEVFPIPEQGRGENIMNGPLPFLFGMPPKVARQRYLLKLLKNNENEVWIAAMPRWKRDQVNYRDAKIILRKPQYLPVAVQIVDPGGEKQTVFTFTDLKVNQTPQAPGNGLAWWKDRDPFKPTDMKGYAIQVHKATSELKTASNSNGPVVVPSVINFRYDLAQSRLKQMGYKVVLKEGMTVNNEQLKYVVYEQLPKAKSPLPPGSTVTLTLYNYKSKTPQATGLPSTIGMGYKEATALLKAKGYQVKVLQGPVTTDPARVYKVGAQSPQPNAALAAGGTVSITVYVKASDVKQ